MTMTHSIDPRIVKARGTTADFMAVTVVTTDPATGEHARIASFAGSAYPHAITRMWSYHHETGRMAWLVRGVQAAYLPLLGVASR